MEAHNDQDASHLFGAYRALRPIESLEAHLYDKRLDTPTSLYTGQVR